MNFNVQYLIGMCLCVGKACGYYEMCILVQLYSHIQIHAID